MDNKSIFAQNLQKQMQLHGKSRREICAALGFSYYTFSDWVKGKKYPRMDKVEKLAAYFGILKSDLIEEPLPEPESKKNDDLSAIIVKLRMDDDFFAVVHSLSDLDAAKLQGVRQMLDAFLK